MSEPISLRAVLPAFLPGKLDFAAGTIADYRTLECFHYLAGRPSTFAAIHAVRYFPPRRADDSTDPDDPPSTLAAIAVLSWPTPCHRTRWKHLGLTDLSFGERLRWVNANLRTISRVIVHPQFRGLGLASALVRRVCAHRTTPYVEATARMGKLHPFFARGGMTEIPVGKDDAAYYLFLQTAPDVEQRPPSPVSRRERAG